MAGSAGTSPALWDVEACEAGASGGDFSSAANSSADVWCGINMTLMFHSGSSTGNWHLSPEDTPLLHVTGDLCWHWRWFAALLAWNLKNKSCVLGYPAVWCPVCCHLPSILVNMQHVLNQKAQGALMLGCVSVESSFLRRGFQGLAPCWPYFGMDLWMGFRAFCSAEPFRSSTISLFGTRLCCDDFAHPWLRGPVQFLDTSLEQPSRRPIYSRWR